MPGIGESLRDARLSRGLTHEYISQVIKIRPEFLAALEEENLSALPGNFYAKTFLRRYADFLNLDSGALVERFVRQENGAAAQTSVSYPSPPPASRPPETRRHWRPNLGAAAMLAVLLVSALALGARAFLMPAEREADIVSSVTATPTDIVVALLPTPTSAPPPPTDTPRPTERPAVAQAPAAAVEPTPMEATATPRSSATRPPRRSANQNARGNNRPASQRQQEKATATPRPTNTPRPTPTNTPKPDPTNTPRPTPTNTPQPTPTNTPRPTATPTPTNTPVPKVTGEIVGTIRTTSPSTVTVKSDGRTVFQDSILPGQVETFSANANLYIYSNSAPNVLVTINECIMRSLDSYGCPGCQIAYYNFPRTYYDCR